MKTITKTFMMLFAVSLFISCDKVEELTQFDVNETYKASADIEIPEDPEGNPQDFAYSATINIAENNDISNNFGNITALVIHELYLEIHNFSGNEDAAVDDAVITLGNVEVNLGTINLAAADAAEQKINIGNSQQIGLIATALMNSATMNVGFSGTISHTPVSFTAEVTLRLTATINPI